MEVDRHVLPMHLRVFCSNAISPSRLDGLQDSRGSPLFEDAGYLSLAIDEWLRSLDFAVTSLLSHVEGMKPLDLDCGLWLEYQDSTSCLTHKILDRGSAQDLSYLQVGPWMATAAAQSCAASWVVPAE